MNLASASVGERSAGRRPRKYIGANIYNRRSFKLKHKRINNPVYTWIRRDGSRAGQYANAVMERPLREHIGHLEQNRKPEKAIAG